MSEASEIDEEQESNVLSNAMLAGIDFDLIGNSSRENIM